MSLALPAIAPAYIHSSVKRRKNTWYSQKDGNWTDANTWTSNAMSYNTNNFNYPGQAVPVPIFPAVGDDVYINNAVTLNTANGSTTVINNLFISGTLLATSGGKTLQVNGNIQATGVVDFTGSSAILTLMNVNNFITTFISGTSSTVNYACIGYDQFIMDLSYRNLTTTNIGTKYVQSNLTVTGNVNVNSLSTLELSTFNFTVNGTTTVAATLSKTGAGSLLFIGQLSTNFGGIFFTGNPSVEMRGGFSKVSTGITNNLGTGVISFTTNNQSVNMLGGGETVSFNNVLIVGAITVTNTSGSPWQINNYIDGTVAGSTLMNSGVLYLNSTTLPMVTFGVFDFTTNSASVVGYVFNGNYTLPSVSYQGVIIFGTGIKTLGGNTTISTTLTITSGNLELSTHNLTVTGISTLNTGAGFSKSGAGNIIFIGQLNISGTGHVIDLSGNPSVELRGGCNMVVNTTILGSSTWTFTTNNQTFANSNNLNLGTNNLLISGAITITFTGSGNITFDGTIDGNNASSTFDNRSIILYKNTTSPIVTGILTTDAAANTFKYNKSGAQNVTGGTYRVIEFGGSGVKTLLGNVIVNVSAGGSQSTTGTATIDLNGFTITEI